MTKPLVALTAVAAVAAFHHQEPGWRQQQREHVTDPAVIEGAVLVDPAPSPLDALIAQEDSQRLHDAIETLPERERRVIEARYFEGRSMPEVAAELGFSESRGWQLERSALDRLRQALEDGEDT